MLDRKSIVLLALLSILGLTGNILKFEMFFNVDFLFGSIFAVLAVQIYGFYGIIVALIASIYTYVLWNHPYAIIIFTAEAAFIASFRKRSPNIVAIDLFYWIICGVPLIFVTYYLVMGLNLKPTILIMMKQSVNGIFGALIASIIYDIFRFCTIIKNKEERISFQHIVFQIIVFIIIVPMVTYVMISVRSNMDFTSQNMRSSFNVLLDATKASVGHYIDDSLLKVEYVEKEVLSHTDDLPGLEREFRDILNSNREFMAIGVQDSTLNGILNADFFKGEIQINKGAGLLSMIPKGVVWRPGEVFITDIEIVKGRKLIYMIKPIFKSPGQIDRFVYCALNFEVVSGIISQMSRGTEIIFSLYDRNGDLIMCTGSEDQCLGHSSERNEGGVVELMSDGIAVWAPKPSENITVMTRWQQSVFTRSVKLSEEMPFALVADQPLISYVRYMGQQGNRALTFIFVVGVMAVSLAQLVSSRITRQISLLSAQSKDLAKRISDGENVLWPDTSLEEAQSLKDNFIDMSRQLNERFIELKKQKEELNLILDNVPQMIILKDTDNNLITANKKAEDTLGFKINEGAVGLHSVDPELAEFYYQKDLRVMTTKEGLFNDIIKYRINDGSFILARVNRLPLLTGDGEVDGILVVIEDITEEMAANDERQKILEVMSHQAKMAEMGAMINTIVHQWKQPLNVIKLVSTGIIDDIRNGRAEQESMLRELEMLDENTDFLNQTITDFADFFRKNKTLSSFNVCSVIKEVYGLIEKEFIRHDIEVIFDEAGAFEVFSIRNEFKQVILNLLNNAKDALAAGKIQNRRIEISFEKHEEFGKIVFKDNAGGIDDMLLPEKLFEPYISTKGTGGTGIGLYVSRNIIQENMHGTIRACNEGEGARFDITIPYTRQEEG